MEKIMYALTFCNEGCENSSEPAHASTLAVSEDREKLVKRMREFIAEDCMEPDPMDPDRDEWDDSWNYSIYKDRGDEVTLNHNTNCDLYITYKIHEVEVL
jgi:hypothetical protein